jgi:hypothetical protein
VSTKISGTKGLVVTVPDKISTTNVIKSHGKHIPGKEGSASVPVKLSLPVGASDKLDELNNTVSPAKLLSDTDKKQQLFARLAELDEKQKVLQEQKEL